MNTTLGMIAIPFLECCAGKFLVMCHLSVCVVHARARACACVYTRCLSLLGYSS